MVEPVSLQTMLTYLTLISVPVGVFYHIMTLRNTRKNQQMQLETRQTQLFMYFNEKFMENREAFDEILDEWSWNDYNDFMRKYSPEANPEEWGKFITVVGLFERMGLLAKEGSVNIQLIYDWMGGYPIRLWDKLEEIIDGYRIEREAPPKGMWMEYFEDLVYMLRDVRLKDLRDLDNRLRRRKIRRQELGRTVPDYT